MFVCILYTLKKTFMVLLVYIIGKINSFVYPVIKPPGNVITRI